MELISNTDFGQTLANKSDADYRRLRDNFDKFCKQPLTLGMFVPCYYRDGVCIPYAKDTFLNSIELFNEFEKAKERVLFKGFEVAKVGSSGEVFKLIKGDLFFYFFKFSNMKYEFHIEDKRGLSIVRKQLSTIEDLTSYSLTLTQTAINQINE